MFTRSHLFTYVIMVHLSSLPDLVLLEIFSYLSCEDALYAIAELNINRLNGMLAERGAFRQIHLSSALSYQRYIILAERIWRFDSVLSLVVEGIFADGLFLLAPRRVFSSLADLRILYARRLYETTTAFVIAHASTLTHLTVTPTHHPFPMQEHSTFFHSILPHLTRLTMLSLGWNSNVQVLFIHFQVNMFF